MKKFFNRIFDTSTSDGIDEKEKTIGIIGIVLIIILAISIRMGNNNETNTLNNNTNNNNQTSKEVIEEKDEDDGIVEEVKKEEKQESKKEVKSNINSDSYTYSYTVTFDSTKESYLGKKLNDKEKFTYISGDTTIEYAIIDDKYFILENDKYTLTDRLDTYYKYCNIEEILDIVSEMELNSENSFIYDVNNKKLSLAFDDKLVNDNGLLNRIELVMDDHNPRSVKMDLSNYISSIYDVKHSLIIEMNFADIGKVENFDIKIN